MSERGKTSVLFVCLGNICRSPTAHGVFASMVAERGMQHLVEVDSCGTGGWHVGEAPDSRATAEARKRGYDLSNLRARQLAPEDFERFDYILPMDQSNLVEVRALCPQTFSGELSLLLSRSPQAVVADVPDPYYGGVDGFSEVLDLVEGACAALLEEIIDADGAAGAAAKE